MSYKQVCAFCFHRTIQEKLKSIFLNQSKFAANKLSAINLSFGLGFFLLETCVGECGRAARARVLHACVFPIHGEL